MQIWKGLFGAGLLLFVLNGCRDAAQPAEALELCQNVVTLKVKHLGPNPVFSWTPNCFIGRMIVTEVQGGATQWSFDGPAPTDTGGVASGVTYGTLPPNSTVVTPDAGLVAGTSYRVEVFARLLVGQDPVPLRSTTFQF